MFSGWEVLIVKSACVGFPALHESKDQFHMRTAVVFGIVLTACFVQAQAELVSSKDAWEQQQESLQLRHQEGLAALKHRLEQQDGSVRAANLSTEQWKAK